MKDLFLLSPLLAAAANNGWPAARCCRQQRMAHRRLLTYKKVHLSFTVRTNGTRNRYRALHIKEHAGLLKGWPACKRFQACQRFAVYVRSLLPYGKAFVRLALQCHRTQPPCAAKHISLAAISVSTIRHDHDNFPSEQ